MNKKPLVFALLTVFLVLLADQVLKIYIKTHYYYNQETFIFGQWFSLLFVENKGMAFGWQLPFFSEDTAKLILSLFRIIAVGVIGYYLFSLIKKLAPTGLIISIALIFSGAIGNIIDSVFYGLIFTESPRYTDIVAEIVPFGKGYTSILNGHVVDMLKFDIFTVDLPWYGTFNFFAPIFNLADAAISVGVAIILLFQRKNFQNYFFTNEEKGESSVATDEVSKSAE